LFAIKPKHRSHAAVDANAWQALTRESAICEYEVDRDLDKMCGTLTKAGFDTVDIAEIVRTLPDHPGLYFT
jgi:hypothetical protein